MKKRQTIIINGVEYTVVDEKKQRIYSAIVWHLVWTVITGGIYVILYPIAALLYAIGGEIKDRITKRSK